MAISKQLKSYLEKLGMKYEVVPHKKVYTAYDLAQTTGKKLDEIAKSLLVRVDLPGVKKTGKYYVLLVPASYRADFNKLQKKLKAKNVMMAPEKIMKKFNLHPGAITPFSKFHNLEVLVDKALLKSKHALVNAGSYTDSLRVKIKDLEKYEGVTLGDFATKAKLKLQKVIKKAKSAVKKSSKKRAAGRKKRA